ncbi:MAG: hypothetical protein HY303_13000 [Candidatus Wallbacteria bacterium]|nr:hypothetical protein [Candidatus Wallbacteria bacterium]
MRALRLLLLLSASVASLCVADETYVGEIVPKDFVPLLAPPNTMSLPHWGSYSNGIQLLDVKPEGERVRKDDVVATFMFRHEPAREQLDRHLAQLKAERDEELLTLEHNLAGLENDLVRQRIKSAQLRLDLLKKGSLSKLKLRLLEHDLELALQDERIFERKVSAMKVKLEWTRGHREGEIRMWMGYLEVFKGTKAHFTAKSPVAGTLHYPTLAAQKRKVLKGDQMNSGVHYLSVVTSGRSEVRFFIPEDRSGGVRVGTKLLIEGLGPSEVTASVAKLAVFPERVGDALRDYRLPNAWDKVFAATADVSVDFAACTNKLVKVRLAP